MSEMPAVPNTMGRKPFQEATVLHAVRQLRDHSGSRRFLVADEVGLGKTLVAQGILQHLAGQSQTFNVFYICSSLTIASQNRDSLLEILPQADRKNALVTVDRPTLLPWKDPSAGKGFTLFTLTPGTMPIKGSSRGRVDERAAIWCLLKEGLPDAGEALGVLEQRLKLVQDSTWNIAVGQRRQGVMLQGIKDLCTPFMTEVRSLFHLAGASDRAVASAMIRSLEKETQFQTIQKLRRRLARLGLGILKPNLVILDEFQRFFEIISPSRESQGTGRLDSSSATNDDIDQDSDAFSLLRLILDARGAGEAPAILLLSATPYRPPAGEHDGAGMTHYNQFFRLLQFLYGFNSTTEVPTLRSLFRRYGELLREAEPGNREVLGLRDNIRSRLLKVVARTERAGVLGADDSSVPIDRRAVGLDSNDIRIYRHLWSSAGADDRSAVTPYWSSIPFPLQMMDQGYLLRKRALPAPIDQLAESPLVLHARQVRRYEKCVPPHPRMRALLADVAGPVLGLPWLPPSLPWWPLGGLFAAAVGSAPHGGLSKTLLFSRFRAVPRAVASLISFESERRVYSEARNKRSYDYHGRGRGGRDDLAEPEPGFDPLPAPSFTWQVRELASGKRELDHSLLSLFAPSPCLGEIGSPQGLSGFPQGKLRRSDALAHIARQIQKQLAEKLGNAFRLVDSKRSGNLWRALIRLERANDQTWPLFRDALNKWTIKTKNQAAKSVGHAWLAEAQSSGFAFSNSLELSEGDIDDLAELALVGPGVVLHRAVQRVFGKTAEPANRMQHCMDIALGALRTYLDEPEFHLTLALPSRSVPNHPKDVLTAIWHGNLESVFDEYFAVHAGLGTNQIDPGREGKILDALEQSLAIRISTIRVQSLEAKEGFGLRCHTAMPFGLTPDKDDRRDEDGAETRPDSLRRAFNSPFRPYVLATTSIGQEGLDFHAYCNRLVHWDMPSSPVDLEQRDGRINRYGGLSIRKALTAQHLNNGASIPIDGSPWLMLTRALTETCEGMAPWWGTPGAVIHRTVFLPPLTKQEGELDRLLASLSHYRLALGQSDPEQLLRALHRRLAGAINVETRAALYTWFREVRIDLAPVHIRGAL